MIPNLIERLNLTRTFVVGVQGHNGDDSGILGGVAASSLRVSSSLWLGR